MIVTTDAKQRLGVFQRWSGMGVTGNDQHGLRVHAKAAAGLQQGIAEFAADEYGIDRDENGIARTCVEDRQDVCFKRIVNVVSDTRPACPPGERYWMIGINRRNDVRVRYHPVLPMMRRTLFSGTERRNLVIRAGA
jgi:hypothetical protein